jgi:hypothetical protein
MQIYTHVDDEARDEAVTGLDKLLGKQHSERTGH